MRFNIFILIIVMILYSSATSKNFKIGSLLPALHLDYLPLKTDSKEASQQSLDCKISNTKKEIAIWNAISFANKEMTRLFREFYSCDISLSQAETQVVNHAFFISYL